MDKEKLVVGKTYLRRRKTVYAGKEAQAESWIKCIQITPAGAMFWGGDNIIKLEDDQIKEEILEHDSF